MTHWRKKIGLHLFNPEGENFNPAEEIDEIPDEYVQNDAVDNDYDSDSSEDEEDVLLLRSGKKDLHFPKHNFFLAPPPRIFFSTSNVLVKGGVHEQ